MEKELLSLIANFKFWACDESRTAYLYDRHTNLNKHGGIFTNSYVSIPLNDTPSYGKFCSS